MSSIEKQLGELKGRLDELTSDEMKLIKELEQALINADNQLQNEIDKVFSSHMQRRECLASSLVDLARNLGRLPAPKPEAATLDYVARSDAYNEQQHQPSAGPSAGSNGEAWGFFNNDGQRTAEDLKLV